MEKILWTVKIKGFGMTYSLDVFAATETEARAFAEKQTGDKAISAYYLPSFT